jgi:hypothetical protein
MKEKITFMQSLLGEEYSDAEQRTIDQYAGKERRVEDRSGVDQFLVAMRDHMYQIKRAMDAGDMERASSLVNGALKSLSR